MWFKGLTGPPGQRGEHGAPGLRRDPVSGGWAVSAAFIQGLWTVFLVTTAENNELLINEASVQPKYYNK